jgi:hypothetical protein
MSVKTLQPNQMLGTGLQQQSSTSHVGQGNRIYQPCSFARLAMRRVMKLDISDRWIPCHSDSSIPERRDGAGDGS